MRIKDVILGLVSLALIGAGATLIVTFFVDPGTSGDSPSEEPQDFNVPVLEEENTQAPGRARGPEDKTLVLTVPKMEIFEALVPDATGNDEEKLRDYAGIHLDDTGFPWEPGANVYIAGHRLGYPYTPSFLAFYDLDVLEEGDEITVLDADGGRYVYTVFEKSVVSPTDLSVTEPVEGKDILTLQTCTLPDYSQRLIVQAEKAV
ncbi:MAG: Sortase (surface protein transpeptidase) [uncultured Rubrobacteraceae bacterium]|uniref:Sortase (Surface protein transpeptidase) n=1 Tax=uncultured Rubrobacteraceae bacterium TaxID=349277 RepID=A0A6J4Q8J7_9ACTN|nr:MAG: Sortase (surface protein transpeptidase) [uncultured Rubrobacteraceae bacterium]